MTSKLVVNTIEADTGISSVSFASSISLGSTSKFFFSDAGIDIGPDTNINRPATGVLGFNINGTERVRITSNGKVGIGTDNPLDSLHISNASPGILITDTDQASNTKNWSITAAVSQVLRIQAQDDSNAGGGNIFDFYKVTNQVNEFRGLQSGNTWFVVDNLNKSILILVRFDPYTNHGLTVPLQCMNKSDVCLKAARKIYE